MAEREARGGEAVDRVEIRGRSAVNSVRSGLVASARVLAARDAHHRTDHVHQAAAKLLCSGFEEADGVAEHSSRRDCNIGQRLHSCFKLDLLESFRPAMPTGANWDGKYIFSFFSLSPLSSPLLSAFTCTRASTCEVFGCSGGVVCSAASSSSIFSGTRCVGNRGVIGKTKIL